MAKFMDRPWFLRFTALFLAIVLFFTVQTSEGNINSKVPGDQVDIIRDVPVDVYYDNENLVVTGVPETVDITIDGPTNLVQTTKLLKDFSLIVDLRTLTMGKHTVQIKHENISDKLQVRIDPVSVDVVIEEKITEEFQVEAEFNERQLAPDFSVVNMEVIPSTIEVTGAKSTIESISFVKATVSGEEGINKSFEQQAKVRILDKDLNKLDVSVVPENVTVKVEVVENNKEVPIVLKAIGTPPDGVVIDSISADQDKLILYGPSQVLNEIKEHVVEIDVSKVDESGTLNVDIKKPKGVSELSISNIKVNVKATVEKSGKDSDGKDDEDDKDKKDDKASSDEPDIEVVQETEPDTDTDTTEDVASTETVNFENVKIAVIGLDKKFTSTLLQPESGLLTLTVIAEPDIVEKLDIKDFTVSIDASETDVEGEQVYPVTVKGPKDIKWLLSENEVKMKVELV